MSAWNTREAREQALTLKLGPDSYVQSKNANTEVMIDHAPGRPRLLVRTKGRPEPDTVDPREVKGK